jgi:hypothetical protein
MWNCTPNQQIHRKSQNRGVKMENTSKSLIEKCPVCDGGLTLSDETPEVCWFCPKCDTLMDEYGEKVGFVFKS